MEGSFTDNLVHRWLQELADEAWVSLHYDTPALADASYAEVFGSGYARKRAYFTMPSNRSIYTTQDVVFSGLPQTQVTHFGLWDSDNVNDAILLAYGAVPDKALILSGSSFVLHEGELSISIG